MHQNHLAHSTPSFTSHFNPPRHRETQCLCVSAADATLNDRLFFGVPSLTMNVPISRYAEAVWESTFKVVVCGDVTKMQPLVVCVHHSGQPVRGCPGTGELRHHHMSKYPQTVRCLDPTALQYFIHRITHSQEGRRTRQIISKVTLPHFFLLQCWWAASVYMMCPLAQVPATSCIMQRLAHDV